MDLSNLALTELALRPNNGASDYVVLPRIDINGTHVDLSQRTVLVDAIKVSGGQIHGWLNEHGGVNLAELGASAARPAPPPAATAAAAAGSASAAPSWSVKVPQIDLQGLSVDFQDRSFTPAPTFTLAPLDINVGQFQWPFGPPLAVQVKSGVNATGTLSAQAQVTLPDAAIKGTCGVVGIPAAGAGALHRTVHRRHPAQRSPGRES
ncbi:MAG: DUF748 domain-containing protein [Steroidobacteraceae bacterium]